MTLNWWNHYGFPRAAQSHDASNTKLPNKIKSSSRKYAADFDAEVRGDIN